MTGMGVIVYHGELIPVDGEMVHGRARIDQKTITGESLPVTRGKGEATFAGTGFATTFVWNVCRS